MTFLNPNKYDLWMIYDRVNAYYTLGKTPGHNKMLAARQNLEKIISDSIHQQSPLNQKWEQLNLHVKTALSKEVIGTTYGRAPAFSSYLQLEKAWLDNLTHTKEIHFFVSLIGPFYTVIGQDTSTVTIEERRYRSTTYLVVSPKNEFAESFNFLCHKIEDQFSGYNFVPHAINRQMIESSATTYDGNSVNVICHALFNDHIDLAVQVIGDEYFRLRDWVREGGLVDDRQWTTYPMK